MNCPICKKPRGYAKSKQKKLLVTCGSKECISKLMSKLNAGNSSRTSFNNHWKKDDRI